MKEVDVASIRARKTRSGTTYAVLFKHDGKQTSKSFDNLKAAENFRDAVNNDSIGPTVAVAMLEQKQPGRTVDDLFIEWLALKASDMTAEAHRDYERGYQKWIKPTLGWRDAELVTEKDVQAWVDKVLRTEGQLASKSVAKQHALLHGMYKWASSKTVGHIENDPCTETKLPKKKKRPPRGLTIPELHTMLAAGVEAGSKDAADVIAAMAGTGWRPGEMLGLLAGSVDVAPNGRVFVTMMTVYRRGEGIVEDGKTDAAGRRIRVLGPGAKVIADRLAGKGINDPVFPHPTTGKPWNPASFTRHYWPKVVKAAGLTLRAPTPYSLRHTHVALCHEAGMTLPEIQRRIGHESIQTTIDVYGKLIEGMSDETADRLDELLTVTATVVQGEIVETGHGELEGPAA